MSGEEALANYEKAKRLVESRQFEEARVLELLPSDRALIERKITQARDSE